VFDVSWSEMLLILLVAVVVIGPKDLPKVMRTVGQFVAKARAMARDFTDQFYEMERQTPLGDLRRDLETAAQSVTRDVNNAVQDTSNIIHGVPPAIEGESAGGAVAPAIPSDAVAAAAPADPVPGPSVVATEPVSPSLPESAPRPPAPAA